MWSRTSRFDKNAGNVNGDIKAAEPIKPLSRRKLSRHGDTTIPPLSRPASTDNTANKENVYDLPANGDHTAAKKSKLRQSTPGSSGTGTERVFDRLYRLSLKPKAAAVSAVSPSSADKSAAPLAQRVRRPASSGNVVRGRVSSKNILMSPPVEPVQLNKQSYTTIPVAAALPIQYEEDSLMSMQPMSSSPLIVQGYHRRMSRSSISEQPDEQSTSIDTVTHLHPHKPIPSPPPQPQQLSVRPIRHARTASAAAIAPVYARRVRRAAPSVDTDTEPLTAEPVTTRRSTAPTWAVKLSGLTGMTVQPVTARHYKNASVQLNGHHVEPIAPITPKNFDRSRRMSHASSHHASARPSISNTPNQAAAIRRLSVPQAIPIEMTEVQPITLPLPPQPRKAVSRISIKATRLRPRTARAGVSARQSVKPTAAPQPASLHTSPSQPQPPPLIIEVAAAQPVPATPPAVDPVIVESASHYVRQGKKPIGVGAFGIVWCVKHYKTFERYALKVISKSKAQKKGYSAAELADLVANEIAVLQMSALQKRVGLMPLLSCFEDGDKYYMRFPLCGGDLYTLLAKFGVQDEQCARYIVACIVNGLEYMHATAVTHRDVKPENVMIGRDGRIYLSDFGTAKQLPADGTGKLHDMAGTLMYVAPEVVRWGANGLEVEPDGHDEKVDCWGLGVVLYLVLTGKLPFHAGDDNDEHTLMLIKAADLQFNTSVKLTREVTDLLSLMLQSEPSLRPTMSALKKHKWFKLFNWTQLVSDKMKPPKALAQQANKLWADIDYASRNGKAK